MKKLLLFSLVTIILCIFIVNSIDETDILKQAFNDEEIAFIKDNSISYSDISPYLKYQNFNIYDYLEYEKIRKDQDYLEAINLFNNKDYYEPYTNTKKAIFLDTNIALVNKHYYIDRDYIPKTLVNIKDYNVDYIKRENEVMKANKDAITSYKTMFDVAKKEGINLLIFSCYRSYEKQEHLYYNVNFENDLYSAKPGHSEHHTGLAFDISTSTHGLTENFALSKEYYWLKNNAYKYGFIERYPKDKTDITLYSYEPWHFRYVGKTIAAFIYNNNYTLEEYIIKNYEL